MSFTIPQKTTFIPTDWYWIVDGSTTELWSSSKIAYVPVDDADYLVWLARGNKPTKIANETELTRVLNGYNLLGPLGTLPPEDGQDPGSGGGGGGGGGNGECCDVSVGIPVYNDPSTSSSFFQSEGLDGWEVVNGTIEYSDTPRGLIVTASAADCYIHKTFTEQVEGARFTRVVISLKRTTGAYVDQALFWKTSGHGYTNTHSIQPMILRSFPVGEENILVYDMATKPDWFSNNITGIKFQLDDSDATSAYFVNYIMVVGPNALMGQQNTAAAQAAADLAEGFAAAAQLYRTGAQTAAATAFLHETGSQTNLTQAQTAKQLAETAAQQAESAKSAAQSAQGAAASSAIAADSSAQEAEAKRLATSLLASQAAQIKVDTEALKTAAELASGAAVAAKDTAVIAKQAAELAKGAAELAESNAQTYASTASGAAIAAAGSASTASAHATDADESAGAAAASVVAAGTHASNASSSASQAATSASNASGSASAAQSSATNAANSAIGAGNSANAASSSASQAETFASNAGNSATSASTHANTASTKASEASDSADAAALSEGNAASSAIQASTSASNAAGSASSASTYASNAAGSATAAGNSANAASNSASLAATSATNAGLSESAAGTYASNAAGAATAAGNSANAASNSESLASTHASDAGLAASQAATFASNAATSATNAGNSANAASNSASTAQTHANNAGDSASAAATSASNAAGSETAAGNSANAASNSASQASTHATNAGSSASQASTSASNAAGSATAAGNSANAASNSASQASTFADNAGQSASQASISAGVSASSSADAERYGILARYTDAEPIATTTFNGSLNGWSATSSTLVMNGTNTAAIWTPTSANPWIQKTGLSFSGSRYTHIVVRVKRTAGTASQNIDQFAYYSTSGHSWTAGFHALPVTGVIALPLGEEVDLIWDMSKLSAGDTDWISNTITGIRIDILNGTPGAVEILYIGVLGPDTAASAKSADAAQTAATAASTSASNALTYANNANTSAGLASTSATNAATAATNAGNSANAASNSASSALGYADDAEQYSVAAQGFSVTAGTAATNAGNSATAANTSAGTAATHATNASNSATAANNAKLAAESARDDAQLSSNAAATSATNASTYATDAETAAGVTTRNSIEAQSYSLLSRYTDAEPNASTTFQTTDGWTVGASTMSLRTTELKNYILSKTDFTSSVWKTNVFSRTNMATWSEQFGNAVWGKTGVTISENSMMAPDGTITADTMTATASVTTLFDRGITVTASSTNDYFASIYIKPGNIDTVCLNMYYQSNTETNVHFTFSTKTVSATLPYPNDYIFDDVGGGWYRIGYRVARDATASRTSLRFRLWLNNRGQSVIGDYVYIWGAQCEAGITPTPYTKVEGTSAAAATPTVLITKNAAISPDGSMNAALIVPTPYGTGNRFIYQSHTFSGVRRLSVIAKSYNGYNMSFSSGEYAPNNYVVFDLQNGVITQNPSSRTAGITGLGNGWYECWFESPDGITNQAVYTWLVSAIQGTTHPGSSTHTGSGGIYLYNPQLTANAATTGGIVWTATGSNPWLTRSGLSIPGSRYTHIIARVKRLTGAPTENSEQTIYYATSGHSHTGSYSAVPIGGVIPLPVGEEVDLIWDMTKLAQGDTDWVNNTITSIRMDLVSNITGSFEILSFSVVGPDSAAAAKSAAAAASSASAASTSATNAGQSATAAQTSATNASTSAGQASTHASNASTSATNASGSASAASTSAGVAASSSQVSQRYGVLARYTDAEPTATTAFTGSLNSWTPFNATFVMNATNTAAVYTPTGADSRLQRSGLSFSGARYTHVVARVKRLQGTASENLQQTLYYSTSGHGHNGAYSSFPVTGVTPLPVGEEVDLIWDMANQTSGAPDWVNSTITNIRFDIIGDGTTGQIEILYIGVLGPDTAASAKSAAAAASSASAAATSASNASTSATNASNSASSASGSANTANTKAGEAASSASSASTSAANASTSATNASNSASAASGHANTASTKAGEAASSATSASTSAANASTSATNAFNSSVVSARISQGAGVLKNPMFSEWASTYPDNWALYSTNTMSKETTDVIYGSNAVKFTVGTSGTQTGLVSQSSLFTGAIGEQYYVIECDFKFISGDLGGSGILVDWVGITGGNRVSIPFNSVGTPVANKRYSIRKVIKRPSDTGTFTGHTIYMMANWPGTLGTTAAKTIIVDRLQMRTATTEEIRTFNVATEISAAVAVESSARVTAIGSVEAKYAVKVDVNGYVSGFGLISTANNAAPTSTFTILADNFLIAKPGVAGGTPKQMFEIGTVGGTSTLVMRGNVVADGSITASKLTVASLSSITANIGTITAGKIQSASGGVKVDLDGDSVRFDANKFEIYNGTAGEAPFLVTGGAVYINGVAIKQGDVSQGASYESNTTTGGSVNMSLTAGTSVVIFFNFTNFTAIDDDSVTWSFKVNTVTQKTFSNPLSTWTVTVQDNDGSYTEGRSITIPFTRVLTYTAPSTGAYTLSLTPDAAAKGIEIFAMEFKK